MYQNMMKNIESRLNQIQDQEKKKLISTIIKNEKWYRDINFDTYISIMQDLGYNQNEAKDIYVLLNSKETN